jgi:hypothetical protein
MLPFLVISLLACAAGIAFTLQGWVELEERPPVGHGASVAGLGVMMIGIVSLFALFASALVLLRQWWPRKQT